MIDDTVGDKVQEILTDDNSMFLEKKTDSNQKLVAYFTKIGINYITEITNPGVPQAETILRLFRELEPESVKHKIQEKKVHDHYAEKLVLKKNSIGVS